MRNPKFFVGNSKCVGTLQRRFEGLNINKFSSHPDDGMVLKQGLYFQDCKFLGEKKEHDLQSCTKISYG